MYVHICYLLVYKPVLYRRIGQSILFLSPPLLRRRVVSKTISSIGKLSTPAHVVTRSAVHLSSSSGYGPRYGIARIHIARRST